MRVQFSTVEWGSFGTETRLQFHRARSARLDSERGRNGQTRAAGEFSQYVTVIRCLHVQRLWVARSSSRNVSESSEKQTSDRLAGLFCPSRHRSRRKLSEACWALNPNTTEQRESLGDFDLCAHPHEADSISFAVHRDGRRNDRSCLRSLADEPDRLIGAESEHVSRSASFFANAYLRGRPSCQQI